MKNIIIVLVLSVTLVGCGKRHFQRSGMKSQHWVPHVWACQTCRDIDFLDCLKQSQNYRSSVDIDTKYGSAYGSAQSGQETNENMLIACMQSKKYIVPWESSEKPDWPPPKFGFFMRDISNQERLEIERNTGVIVKKVIRNTPIFYANAFRGDVIIAIDGIQVKNVQHCRKIIADITKKSSTLTILRKGVQKDIVVHFTDPNDQK
jgi:hypothetical protein